MPQAQPELKKVCLVIALQDLNRAFVRTLATLHLLNGS